MPFPSPFAPPQGFTASRIAGGTSAAQFATLGVGVAVTLQEIVAFTLSGTIASAAGAVWNGFHVNAATATISGVTNITTANGFNLIQVEAPALVGTVTVTAAASLAIIGPPTISGGGAITTAWSFLVAAGAIGVQAGTAVRPAFSFSADPDTGVFSLSANVLGFGTGSSLRGAFSSSGFHVESGAQIGWSSGTPTGSNADTILTRGAANHLYLASGDAFSIGGTAIASGTQLLQVSHGTAPTSQTADSVSFYSSDISAGNTEPSFYCEGTAVLATGQADSVSSVRVKMRINGTEVTLLAI